MTRRHARREKKKGKEGRGKEKIASPFRCLADPRSSADGKEKGGKGGGSVAATETRRLFNQGSAMTAAVDV